MGKYNAQMKQSSTRDLVELTTTLRSVIKAEALADAVKELEERKKNEDVFASKKTEQNLLKQETARKENISRYEKIFNEGPLGMCIATSGQKIVQVNPTLCKMLGYSEKEFLQMNIKDITLSVNLFKQAEALKNLAKGEISIYIGESQYVRKDGKIFWGGATVSALRNEKGEFLHFLFMIKDITQSKEAEKALFKNKLFLDNLIESLPVGLSVINKSSVRIIANQTLCEMTGFDREELQYSTPPFKFWPPEHLEEISRSFSMLMFGALQESELTFMRKNGERFCALINPSYLKNEHGELEYIVVSIKDISSQKKNEQIIKQSEEKYRMLVENVNVGIFQSLPDGKFIHANNEVIAAAGYKDWNEFQSVSAKDLYVHASDRDRFFELLNKNGIVKNLELQSRKKDGTIYWISLGAVPIREKDGQITSLMGFIKDITERKEAELKIRESENLFKESQKAAQIGSYHADLINDVWKSSAVLDEVFGIDEKFERNISGWVSLIHPEDQKMMSDYLAKEVIEEGNPFRKEYRIIRLSDKAERWVLGLGDTIRNDQGQVTGLIGTIQDITERKEA